MIKKPKRRELPVIGWREWVRLPGLGVENIKVKVDSGAKSSSLHAAQMEHFQRDDKDWVRFAILPLQSSKNDEKIVEAEVLEFRNIRSSNGEVSRRPVIVTTIEILGLTWELELTLASRDNMGFRMLLGRDAFRKRFLVDVGRSYCGGKPGSLKTL